MKLHEHVAKDKFRMYGIPVPQGAVVSDADEIAEPPLPCAIKAQVLVGGRGKAGGIKFASTLDEARAGAKEILGMDIRGCKVSKVLIEPKLSIEKEYYLSFVVDRSAREPLLIASADGGMEIEEVPEDRLYKKHISPFVGFPAFVGRDLCLGLGLKGDAAKAVAGIARNLYQLFGKEDAELAEINPLALTSSGQFVAADGKLVIDDDAVFRHPELKGIPQDHTPLEAKAKEKDIAFIQLDGDIGVIANGAGLTMATLDAIMAEGGKAGVFLDLGGTDDPEKVKAAFLLMKEANPSVILMNIFGGITKCDTVALGVRDAMKEGGMKTPVVARIKGLNEAEAKRILADAGLIPASTMMEAARMSVEARERGRS